MKVFKPFTKQPTFQPERAMCVSTAIKNVLDNQFTQNALGLKEINKLCKYDGIYQGGIPLEMLPDFLAKPLNILNIIYNFKENNKIDDLYDLLSQGIYPIVVFHLKDYNQWHNKRQTEVIGDNEPNYHVLIIVGIDKENQKILLFDTIHNKYKNYNDLNNIYDEISFVKFLEYWVHKELIYPCIWFSPKKNKPEVSKNQKKIGDY